jgi:hypothetical protein
MLTVTGTRRHEQGGHCQRHENHTVPHIPDGTRAGAVRLPCSFLTGAGLPGSVAVSGPAAGSRPAYGPGGTDRKAERGRHLAACQACTASTSSAAGWGTETSTAVPRCVVTRWYATGAPFRVTECTVAPAASTVPMVRARPCAPVTSVR